MSSEVSPGVTSGSRADECDLAADTADIWREFYLLFGL